MVLFVEIEEDDTESLRGLEVNGWSTKKKTGSERSFCFVLFYCVYGISVFGFMVN